jgi:hypothetical protein
MSTILVLFMALTILFTIFTIQFTSQMTVASINHHIGAFPFESYLGEMKKEINGTNKPLAQY